MEKEKKNETLHRDAVIGKQAGKDFMHEENLKEVAVATLQDTVTFGIKSEVYKAGSTEDGTPYIAEVFFVVAQEEDGKEWEHPARFPGARYWQNEDSFGYEDVREEAKEKVNALIQSLQHREGFSFAGWNEIQNQNFVNKM